MAKTFFDNITGYLSDASKKLGLGRIHKMLESKFGEVLNMVLKERKADPDNSNLSPEDAKEILNSYLKQNVILATATSFIPGPAGVLASIPNTVASLANQMRCTYDIACAYGKENMVIKDLLLDIPLQSLGIPTNLAKIQGLKSFKEGASDIITEKIKGLGKVVINKKLKGAMTSMLPGMSTIWAITQAKLETAKVAATSIKFFDPQETLEEIVIDKSITPAQIQEEKIKALVNLMTLDSKAMDEEIEFISPIIKESELAQTKKKEYQKALTSSKTDYVVNFQLLKKSGTYEDLVVDLAVLTKRDGDIGPRELEYVKFAAQKLGIQPIVYEQILK